MINSLAPAKFEWKFRYVIMKWIFVIDDWGISREIALIWRSLDFTDDQSTLFQLMAWCRQATSHYLSQCWPRSLSPYGVTRSHWVNIAAVAASPAAATAAAAAAAAAAADDDDDDDEDDDIKYQYSLGRHQKKC